MSRTKTSLSLDSDTLEIARAYGINISAVSEAALKEAVRQAWLTENAEAFKAQSQWHETHGHPLAEIMAGPLGTTWND